MKRLMILFSLLFLSGASYGQYSIQGTILSPAADTTALKLKKSIRNGTMVYLTELASGDGIGSGWFVYMDSTYVEGCLYGGIAFDASTSGKQWIRRNFLDKKEIDITWAGVKTNDSTAYATNGTVFESLFSNNSGKNYNFVFSDTVWTDSLTLTDVDYINIVGRKNAYIRLKLASDPAANVSPFWLKDCDDWYVENITFDCRDTKYSNNQYVFVVEAVSAKCKNFKFINNTFRDCGTCYFWSNTGNLEGSWRVENVTFDNNITLDPSNDTSGLFYIADSCQNFTVTNNIYRGAKNKAHSGTAFASGTYLCNSLIHHNEIDSTSDSSIYFRGTNLVISDNIIKHAGKDAIKNLNNENRNDRPQTIINGNHIWGAGFIEASGGVAIEVEGYSVQITNNYMIAYDTTATVTTFHGVKCQASYALIQGNYIYGDGYKGEAGEYATSLGIYHSGSDTSVVIKNNYVKGCANAIYFASSSTQTVDVTIDGNEIIACNNGIDWLGTSSYETKRLLIQNNVLRDIATYGINVSRADTVTIMNNIGFKVAARMEYTNNCTIERKHNNYDFTLSNPPPFASFKLASTDSILFDIGDYLKFDATNNRLIFYVGGSKVDSLSAP